MKKIIFRFILFISLTQVYSEDFIKQQLAQQWISGNSINLELERQNSRKEERLKSNPYVLKQSRNDEKTSSSSLWENFLELGLTQLSKTKKKSPEDLSAIINSIRIANQFQNQEVTLAFQESEIPEKKPKKSISYSISPSNSIFFVNFTYKFYDNQLEYRRYYDTKENFTLDSFVTDYRESKIKLGGGPLDFFKDSFEASFYLFRIESKGIYEVQTRQIPQSEVFLARPSTLSYFFYNYLRPGSVPLSYIYGNNKVNTSGIGFYLGSNIKFWKIFSIYNVLDFTMFRIKATLSNLSPSYSFYNQTARKIEYVPQIIYVTKNLDFNMLFYYELGFSVTVGKVGFKWGVYFTMPLILDIDLEKPKGYIIALTNPIQINSLEEAKIFYKGDLSNKTQKVFDIFLGGITFGAVSKF